MSHYFHSETKREYKLLVITSFLYISYELSYLRSLNALCSKVNQLVKELNLSLFLDYNMDS